VPHDPPEPLRVRHEVRIRDFVAARRPGGEGLPVPAGEGS